MLLSMKGWGLTFDPMILQLILYDPRPPPPVMKQTHSSDVLIPSLVTSSMPQLQADQTCEQRTQLPISCQLCAILVLVLPCLHHTNVYESLEKKHFGKFLVQYLLIVAAGSTTMTIVSAHKEKTKSSDLQQQQQQEDNSSQSQLLSSVNYLFKLSKSTAINVSTDISTITKQKDFMFYVLVVACFYISRYDVTPVPFYYRYHPWLIQRAPII